MVSSTTSIYTQIDSDFYHRQLQSKNPLRSWFHSSRYRIANTLVRSKYREGKKIADLGCGSCDWNSEHLSVFGVDFNEGLLKVAKQNKRLVDYKVASATRTGLPEASFDIVTAFELLEHVEDYPKVIAESRRLLKPDGHCIISVPYDVLFSLWRPLFFLHTLFRGYILQDAYYKKKCGHLNCFSVQRLRKIFLSHGYRVDSVFVMHWFTIFLCAQKQ